MTDAPETLSGLPVLRLFFVQHGRVATALAIVLMMALTSLWLALLGRPLLPASPLEWFSRSDLPGDNSQHLSDAYSLAHAASGAGLGIAARIIRPHWDLKRALLVAVLCSAVWEMVENTTFIIALFNHILWSDSYRGDSIVNALSDTVFVVLGFLPVWGVTRRGRQPVRHEAGQRAGRGL